LSLRARAEARRSGEYREHEQQCFHCEAPILRGTRLRVATDLCHVIAKVQNEQRRARAIISVE
jgi:hypothetical protein